MEYSKKLDEVWLKSIHETQENNDEDSEKRKFDDKDFDYLSTFNFDDISVEQGRF